MVATHFSAQEARKEAEKISKYFSDYQAELKKSGSDNSEVKKLALQSLLSDANTSEKEKSNYKEIYSILGSEIDRQKNINTLIQERIGLLKKDELLASKLAESEESLKTQDKYTKDPMEFKRMQIDYQEAIDSGMFRSAAATKIQGKYNLGYKAFDGASRRLRNSNTTGTNH